MNKQSKIINDIAMAKLQLENGNLVAFPTETVYGLGADARNPAAIQKVFAAKGRPADHPLIVHIGKVADLAQWAIDIPSIAWDLAARFWPGPLTFILRKHPDGSDLITGGQDTIAIRMPKHDVTLNLLQQFGSGLVGPSANKFGRVSPTSAQHVADDLIDIDVLILDGGACELGIESTIVDLSNEQPIIRRMGAITADDLGIATYAVKPSAIRTPGNHAAHYAPVTAVQLVHAAELLAMVDFYLQQQMQISVLSFMARPASLPLQIVWQQMPDDAANYAHNLYANLRAHDQMRNDAILIESPQENNAWLAVIDRLTRASHNQVN